jgi:hypothetical protein
VVHLVTGLAELVKNPNDLPHGVDLLIRSCADRSRQRGGHRGSPDRNRRSAVATDETPMKLTQSSCIIVTVNSTGGMKVNCRLQQIIAPKGLFNTGQGRGWHLMFFVSQPNTGKLPPHILA